MLESQPMNTTLVRVLVYWVGHFCNIHWNTHFYISNLQISTLHIKGPFRWEATDMPSNSSSMRGMRIVDVPRSWGTTAQVYFRGCGPVKLSLACLLCAHACGWLGLYCVELFVFTLLVPHEQTWSRQQHGHHQLPVWKDLIVTSVLLDGVGIASSDIMSYQMCIVFFFVCLFFLFFFSLLLLGCMWTNAVTLSELFLFVFWSLLEASK